MAAMRDLGIPHDKLNVHGGACALGHPIGASGARIIVTLLAALAKYNLRRGIAALCIGGGEATAVAIERISVEPAASNTVLRGHDFRRAPLRDRLSQSKLYATVSGLPNLKFAI